MTSKKIIGTKSRLKGKYFFNDSEYLMVMLKWVKNLAIDFNEDSFQVIEKII